VKNAVALLIVLASAVAIAGCGGGGGGNGDALSKEDYETQMQALQADLSASATELQEAFNDPSDVSAMADGLNNAADLLDEASASLDDIAPPDDVADAHQTMVDTSAAAASDLRELAENVETQSLAELQTTLADFQNLTAFTDLQAAVTEIQSKGYDIGGTGS
jgi:uncharacterized membrane protein